MRPSTLVALFIYFSTLSFLLACTGLLAVVVGSCSLYRPRFFEYFENLDLKLTTSNNNLPNNPPRTLTPNHAEILPEVVQFDDLPFLCHIILDNLLRVKRLGFYLGWSLVFTMVAFVCGAFAIVGRQKWDMVMLVGTMAVGGVVVLLEVVRTLAGPTVRPPKPVQYLTEKVMKWCHLTETTTVWLEEGKPDTLSNSFTSRNLNRIINLSSASLMGEPLLHPREETDSR